MEDLNLLRQVPFFSDLQDQDLKVLAEVGHEEHYRQDSIIIDEGEINHCLYFLVDGQVKVSLEKISGRALTLSVLKPGNLFGDVCLIGDNRPSPKVVALTDATVIRFSKDDFLAGISHDPVILSNILRETCSRQSHNIEAVYDINGEGLKESKLQKEISIFEKRFAIELEGIKLISKRIEDISTDTSAYIKDKSEETIAWVEQRSKEAIESSEKRSREVTERAEKQAAQAIALAEKTIAIALEEANTRTEAVIAQIEKAISATRAETDKAIMKVEGFGKNFKRIVKILIPALTVLGALLGWLGYGEYKDWKETKKTVQTDKDYIDKVKNRVEIDSKEFEKKMGEFRSQFIDLAALKAMVLTIDRIRHEVKLDGNEIDRYKRSHITYQENRKNLRQYFSAHGKEYHKPEVIVEALNNFLNLISYSNDTVSLDEQDDILNTCRDCLAWVKDRNFQYRLKLRENLILFGKVIKKDSPFYNDQFIPSLNGILMEQGFDDDTKFTVAEALAALEEGSGNCVNVLVREMNKADSKKFWRRASAAVSLVHLNNQEGNNYLFNEMKQHLEKRKLIAALCLGEAMAKSDAIKLKKVDRHIVIKCLEEGMQNTQNRFQKDYAKAIREKLREKEKL